MGYYCHNVFWWLQHLTSLWSQENGDKTRTGGRINRDILQHSSKSLERLIFGIQILWSVKLIYKNITLLYKKIEFILSWTDLMITWTRFEPMCFNFTLFQQLNRHMPMSDEKIWDKWWCYQKQIPVLVWPWYQKEDKNCNNNLLFRW